MIFGQAVSTPGVPISSGPQNLNQGFSQGLEPADSSPIHVTLPSGISQGDYILAFARWQHGSIGSNATISDTRGNTWIPLFVGTTEGAWYAIAKDSGPIEVTANSGVGPTFHGDFYVLDVPASAGTLVTGVNSGDSASASVAADGFTIAAVPLYAHNVNPWSAAMAVFEGAHGKLAIAFITAELGFAQNEAIPAGWANQIPASVNSWSEVLSASSS
jgi:hypothetical protein